MWRPGTVYRKESIVIRRYFLVVAVLACAGCGASGTDDSSSVIDNLPDSTEERFTIVCTTAMVSDVVKQVVGEHAEVVGLLGESVDPHIYQPNRGDMQRLGSADLVIYSGLLLEGKFDDAFDQGCYQSRAVLTRTAQERGGHIWLPRAWRAAHLRCRGGAAGLGRDSRSFTLRFSTAPNHCASVFDG